MIDPEIQERLIAEATRSRENAVAGRSGFSVGAAIEADDGRIFGDATSRTPRTA